MSEITLHPMDITGPPGIPATRYWKSPAHVLYHIRELVPLLPQLGRIYLRHALPPTFRERLMLVTADSNGCPW